LPTDSRSWTQRLVGHVLQAAANDTCGWAVKAAVGCATLLHAMSRRRSGAATSSSSVTRPTGSSSETPGAL
jgi:hypothetical protein